MRTGAIFARGSCRALKWMALFGVVFALGVGSAAAQPSITVPATVGEADLVTLTVGGNVTIDPGAVAGVLTVTAVAQAGTADGLVTAGEANDFGDFTTARISTPANTGAAAITHPISATFLWQVGIDDDAEDEAITLDYTVAPPTGVTAADPTNADLTITDSRTQSYTLSLPAGTSAITEGAANADGTPAPTTLTLEAVPAKTVAVSTVNFTLSTNSATYTLNATADQDLAAGGILTATLHAANDGNRMDDAVTVTATAGTGGNERELIAQSIDVTDIHKLPMLAGDLWDSDDMEVTSAMEGADYSLRVFPVDADGDRIAATEDWTVTLTAGGTATEGESADYTLGDSVTIATNTVATSSHNTAPLMVMDDNDLDPNETVVITATVMGDPANGPGSESMELLTVTIADGTMPLVTAKPDTDAQAVITAALSQADPHGFNPDDSITFDPSEMFNAPADGYELGYEVSSGDAATVGAGVSNGMVTLNAMAVGSTMVTVTARARMSSAIAQTQADVAQVAVSVDVVAGLPVPGRPTSLMAVAGNGQVTLTWGEPTDGGPAERGFEYTYGIGTAREPWMPHTESVNELTVTGLENGKEYTFEVRAMNAAGSGPAATAMATPMAPAMAPGAPQNLTAAAGDGQVTLSWEAPSSGDAPSGFEYRVTGAGVSGEWMATSSMTGHTVTGLTNGTEYTFEVRAVNSAGSSDPVSAKATPMVPDPGVQVTVKEVRASATSVPESGGLEVTVVATVPAGTKVGDKVAPIASRTVMVSFPTDDASIKAGQDADAGEVTALGASGGAYTWTSITRTDKVSEQTYKFRVAIGQDLDAENEKFQVEVQIDGAAKRSKVVTIDDAEEQTYVLSLPSAAKGAIKEGAAATTLTLKAVPARTIDIPAALALNPNDPSKYTLGSLSSDTFGIAPVTASISAKADGNRVDDTITVTAYSGALGAQAEIASLDITVTDANALPKVKATLVGDDGKALDQQPESVMEGETVKVMLTVVDDKDGKAMKAAEKLTITLMPTGTADGQDYRLSTHPIEIAKDKESSAVVDLMVTEDQDIGDETLMFDAAVAGDAKIGTEKRSVAGVLSLMITDSTQKLVWANSQEEVEAAVYAAKTAGAGADEVWTEGEMIEVMGGLLFSSAEGVTLTYTAESDMTDVASVSVSGGRVMVTAAAEGMAHITITAHASMPSGVMILDQTEPDEASVMFPVEVGLEALSIMLAGPEGDMMNLTEGMSAEVTATANRPVTADTMVMLMRDRAMSSASDEDYTAEAITIPAGETMGSTMIMAVEDNMAEDMEELVLYGMTEGMAGEVTGEVHLHLWDAAVPALPVIAQLLLAAFLAAGGYRRYRRR